jgi:hypothetical protein
LPVIGESALWHDSRSRVGRAGFNPRFWGIVFFVVLVFILQSETKSDSMFFLFYITKHNQKNAVVIRDTSSLQCFRYSPTPRGISDLYGSLQPSGRALSASGINASGNHIQHISPNVMFLLWLTYHVLAAQHFRFLLFFQLFVAFCLFLLCWYYPKNLLISGCGM